MNPEINGRSPPAAAIQRTSVQSGEHQPKVTFLIGTLENRNRRKSLTEEARTAWGLLHGDDLLRAKGNIQRLARLSRLRYAESRTASDLQVREFFARHYPDA